MVSRRGIVFGAAAAAAFGAGWGAGDCRATVAAARRRVSQRSQLLATRFGLIEYAVAGRGAPLLMVHGTGGGFDQGLRFGEALSARFQVLAPSRFGYLRSAFPDDPSPARQADAFAALLDHLEIDRLPVVGGSAGALPAAKFAQRHPDRCTALVLLVPAMNLSGRDPVAFTPLQAFAVARLLGSDFWFWLALRLAPRRLIGTLLATDPRLLDTVPETERRRAELILHELMPVSARTRGMLNDGYHSGHPAEVDFAAIRAPMLVVSAEDDRFGTAGTARTIAGRVPGAKLVIYPDGGHIWLGHDAALAAEITAFVAAAGPQQQPR